MITKIYGLLSKPICLIAITIFFAGHFTNLSEAQTTTRPTISPWLSMFNNRSGSLPNYQAFVRPQMDVLRELQNQSDQLKIQDAKQRSLTQTLEAPRLKPSLSGSQPAGFRQYLHYYQGLPQGGVPNFNGGKRR
ncbi:MAG: hypothetical protein LBP59_07615 [Planctomycetaceae bacterium]|jgi:hypothetical protein|nr:hypothetical protein [Planctomycetaceae bacterium]